MSTDKEFLKVKVKSEPKSTSALNCKIYLFDKVQLNPAMKHRMHIAA